MIHWADYLILSLSLVISIGIGVYHACTGGKQNTNEEFIMGNRKLKVLPTAISLVVTFKSALTIIGAPAEMYSYGLMQWPFQAVFAGLVASLIVSQVIIPWLYPLKLTSVYSYFKLRYGTNAVQIYSTLHGILTSLLLSGAVIFGTSVALEIAGGMPSIVTIPVMTIVCVTYTALGGMRAVIWTDVFQSVVMIAGQIVILIKVCFLAGGLPDAFTAMKHGGRFTLSYSPDPTVRHTFWGLILGNVATGVCLLSTQQSAIQRFSAVSTLAEAKRIPFVWLVGSAFTGLLSYLTGIALFGFYYNIQCDPIASGKIRSPNQILALFVSEEFDGAPGFLGLFIATLLSATMSTVSSNISGAAANTWDDIMKPLFPTIQPNRATAVTKAMVVIYGIISMGLAFIVGVVRGPLIQVAISLMSVTFGPLFGLLILAGVRRFTWISWKSALSGSIMAFAFVTWMLCGSITVNNRHPRLPPVSSEHCSPPIVNGTYQHLYAEPCGLDRFYSISYLWYTPIGIIATLGISAMIAAVTGFCQKHQVAPSTDMHIPSELFIIRSNIDQDHGNDSELEDTLPLEHIQQKPVIDLTNREA